MAEQRQQMVEESVTGFDDQISKEKEKYVQERKLANGKKEFDLRLKKMESLLSDAYLEYGPDHYITQIYMNFYDLFIQLKETIHLITGINTVTQVLFETVNFFDESFNYQNELFKSSLKQKYGFFRKLREKILSRRVSRNISNRMSVMTTKIASLQGISNVMVTSLQKSTEKMKASMRKQNEKAAKKREKQEKGAVGNVVLSQEDSPSAKFLKEHFGGNGEGVEETSTGGESASAAPSTPENGDMDW